VIAADTVDIDTLIQQQERTTHTLMFTHFNKFMKELQLMQKLNYLQSSSVYYATISI
jgi:hypothetical protein